MAEKLIKVPKEVIDAVCEVAELILRGNMNNTPIMAEKYGDTSVTYAIPHTDSGLNEIKRTLSKYGAWRSASGVIYRA